MTELTYANDYEAGLASEARRLCLTLATILGDSLDNIVVVGGLVPYLIVDPLRWAISTLPVERASTLAHSFGRLVTRGG